jgi:flagellar hook-associated protein 2
MDTESLVSQLSEAYQMKVDNVKKDQTKLEWKKEAWKGLNTKIMDFYKGSLSTFRSVSTYRAKKATGDLSGVKVTAGNNAVNGTHRVQVKNTATAQMWTGGKITNDDGSKAAASTKLVDLGIANGSTIKINGNAIDIDENTTLSSLASQMNKLGIEANYDAGQGRFYLNAKGPGEDNAFTLEGSDTEALEKLGLNLEVDADGDGKLDEIAGRIDASDAIIEYNGVEYKQSSATFNINGLTIEAVEKGDMQTFTV